MPPTCAQELAAGIPTARLILFERSGHYPFLEELDAFWAAVRIFLFEGIGANTGDPGHARICFVQRTG
jgi:pimeloyl-ACP methyl ester carboxylesterase